MKYLIHSKKLDFTNHHPRGEWTYFSASRGSLLEINTCQTASRKEHSYKASVFTSPHLLMGLWLLLERAFDLSVNKG